MGFGLDAIKLMRLIKHAKILKPDFTVIELGNQDFVPAVAEAQASIFEEFGFNDADLISYPGALYGWLGAPRYESIDLSGERGAHPFDLSMDIGCFYGFRTKFDLVTNFGVTSSLFDQKTVFKNIHELTVVGGTMLHSVPFRGFQHRGLFSYDPSFFLYLAAANEYQLMGMFVTIKDELFSYDEAFFSRNQISADKDVQLVTVLVKKVEMAFVDVHDRAGSLGYRDLKPDLVIGSPAWPFPLNVLFFQNIQVSMSARAASAGMTIDAWDGCGDPFLFHQQAAIRALSDGVAAIYGYDVDGEIAEFGTESGQTAIGLAKALQACDKSLGNRVAPFGPRERRLVLFDSFEGLPLVSPDSIDGRSPHVQDGIWSAGRCKGLSPQALAQIVYSHLPPHRVEIIRGWFKESVPALSPLRRFALLHIDSDLYVSAMDILDPLLARGMIVPGAYVFFDDWNCNGANPNTGERRAWRELVEKYEIIFSDERSYGIFARCFIIHNYRGCDGSSEMDFGPLSNAQSGPTEESTASITTTDGISSSAEASPAEAPAFTDVLDHQSASRHFHEISGMADVEKDFLAIYERCRVYSMTSFDRM